MTGHLPTAIAITSLFAAFVAGCGGQSTPGRSVVAADAGPHPSEAGMSAACCQGDVDCPSGKVCADTQCLAPQAGACWRNLDCPLGDRCTGVRICGCNEDCSFDAVPGTCAPPANDAGVLPGCPPVPLLPAGSSCDLSQAGTNCEYPASQFGAGYCQCEKTASGYVWQCQ